MAFVPQPFPAAWTSNEKDQSIGPVKLWHAPYVANGAAIVDTDIISAGILSNDGIEFDHKVTYAMSDVQQLLYALSAAITKQELDLKFTVHHLHQSQLRWFLGLPSGGSGVSLDPDYPFNEDTSHQTFPFGEPGDPALSSEADGTGVEADYRTWLFQFQNPGYNFQTSPKRGYAYFRAWKAAVTAHGPIKFTKTGYATIQCTLKCFCDLSVTPSVTNGLSTIGRMETLIPV